MHIYKYEKTKYSQMTYMDVGYSLQWCTGK